jgi:hypothetical protein
MQLPGSSEMLAGLCIPELESTVTAAADNLFAVLRD